MLRHHRGPPLIARTIHQSFACLAVVVLVVLSSLAARAETVALPADQAFRLSAYRQADRLTLEWKIAPGYYLYRDRIRLTSNGVDVMAPLSGHGMSKDDPTFGPTEIYHEQVAAIIPEASATGGLTVSYQGCQEGGICYPPITRHVDPVSLAITAPSAKPTNTAVSKWPAPPANNEPNRGAIVLATDDGGGLVASLLRDGGISVVLGSFLLFGIGLAFTPCVFPMYPILAGAIARAGERVTPLRGFTLSGVYVLSMSSAFGLLGIAAAWSGQNLQMALQSPIAVGAVAVLFVGLALSMFGAYELQLPSRWVNALGRVGGGNRGSLASTSVLGFTSALIVGPCVTAPLAGALLYVAQSGDVALGAMSLFALGIGKGIPLTIFGTIGPQAMPKAGRWLVKIKELFGFVFLGLAITMLDRFIPAVATSALWGALAVGIGIWLGALDFLRGRACMTCRLGPEALGMGVAICGLVLAVTSIGGYFEGFHVRMVSPPAPASMAGNESFLSVANEGELAQRIASNDGKPTFVYVTADWCITCAVIDHTVLADAAVRAGLAGFNLVKVDVSANSPAQQQVMGSLKVVGPPTMIFVDRSAKEVPGTRLVGEISTDTLLASAGKAENLR